MQTDNIYMLLFCATLTITYAAVRLAWVSRVSAFIVGTMINGLCFFLYSTARHNTFSYALVLGLLLGTLFTALSIALSRFFRSAAQETADFGLSG
jgi:hypothetical protein